MKKIFSMCLFMLVMVIGSVASANYPTHLNGNANYILVDGHMGTAWYVDKSSLVVQKYEPPQYIIAVNVVSASSAYDERDFYQNVPELFPYIEFILYLCKILASRTDRHLTTYG